MVYRNCFKWGFVEYPVRTFLVKL